jgi:hypothetical protein
MGMHSTRVNVIVMCKMIREGTILYVRYSEKPLPEPENLKLLRTLKIDSKDSMQPGCVAWRAGTTILILLGSYSPNRLLKNSSSGQQSLNSLEYTPRRKEIMQITTHICFIFVAFVMYYKWNTSTHRKTVRVFIDIHKHENFQILASDDVIF